MVNKEQRIEILEELQESLQAKNDGVSSALLPRLTDEFQVDDWAWLLESLTNEQRVIIWPQLEGKETSSILAAMRDDARQQFVSSISSKELSKALADSTAEEAIEVIDVLPQKVATRLIKRMTKETQAHIKANLNYDEDQVGRYANHDVYTIPTGLSVGELRAELKSNDLPDYTDSFLIVDEDNKLLGEITINELFSAEPEEGVMGLSHFPEQIIKAEDSLLDASNQLKNTNKSMLPVVTEHGELLGRFDVNDALIVFQQHYEEQIAHLGKVSDEDLFAPVLLSARRRAVWLGINLATAFLASFVIGVFDTVLAEVVALAVLMPIVASMGGITGSQTLTLTIRGLATGQLGDANISLLQNKELRVASLNGVLWAVLVAVLTGLWFENAMLSGVIAIALVVNMLVAALFGILIPVALDKLNIDPALAGSVILTTVTDVVGFFVFLGSASLVLI